MRASCHSRPDRDATGKIGLSTQPQGSSLYPCASRFVRGVTANGGNGLYGNIRRKWYLHGHVTAETCASSIGRCGIDESVKCEMLYV